VVISRQKDCNCGQCFVNRGRVSEIPGKGRQNEGKGCEVAGSLSQFAAGVLKMVVAAGTGGIVVKEFPALLRCCAVALLRFRRAF